MRICLEKGHRYFISRPLNSPSSTLGCRTFSPLQKASGGAVAQHMEDTRTGVAKGAFCQGAQLASNTPTNIKVPGATSIVPCNPKCYSNSFRATLPMTKLPVLSLRSTLPLEHSSFPRPLSIAGTSPAGTWCYILNIETPQFPMSQNNLLLAHQSEAALVAQFRRLRLQTFAGSILACGNQG